MPLYIKNPLVYMIPMPRDHINASEGQSILGSDGTTRPSSTPENDDDALFILLNEASIPLYAHYLSKVNEKNHVLDENDENLLVFAALANSLIGILHQLKSLLGYEDDIQISLSRTGEGFTVITFGPNLTFAEIIEDLVRDGTLSTLKVDEGNNLLEESRIKLVRRLNELITTKEAIETLLSLKRLIKDLKAHLQDKIDFIIVFDLKGNYITSTLTDPMAVTTFGKGILSQFVRREYSDKALVYDLNDNIKLYYRSTGHGANRTSLWHVGIDNYVYVFFKHRIQHIPPGMISFHIESFINSNRRRFDLPYPRAMLDCANKHLDRTLKEMKGKNATATDLEQHVISIKSKKSMT